MNLQDLNNPLPKPWLNIKANNFSSKDMNTGILNAGSIFSVFNFKYTNLTIQNSSAPTTLPASDVVSALFAYDPTTAATLSLTLPSAAELLTYFPQGVTSPVTFEFKLYSKLSTVNVTLGANCLMFYGGNTFSYSGPGGVVATFYGNSNGFTVFVA